MLQDTGNGKRWLGRLGLQVGGASCGRSPCVGGASCGREAWGEAPGPARVGGKVKTKLTIAGDHPVYGQVRV